ncbi:STAS domain-containing protein [Streptomyces sp. DH12]|uniref:STAS domain-containing protein n=1 Tax=Streptomyces sp. DH12 TaxID=2857010 RepID=UPI001E546A2D|nr:STAS domain-containing protein [Streptomyces sp. DH12]
MIDSVGADRVLVLRGELDIEAGPWLVRAGEEALARGWDRLVLDCRQVSFCDSSGLNTLLRLRTVTARAGVPLVLAVPSRSLRHVLRITETDRVLTLTDSLEEALGRRPEEASDSPDPGA